MKLLSRIWFPAAVLAFASAGAVDFGSSRLMSSGMPEAYDFADTVIYDPFAYRSGPVTDSSLLDFADSLEEEEVLDLHDSLADRLSPRDSLKALLDSSLWDKLDSIYIADSIAKAKAKFEAWYNSLTPKERRKYDAEQRMNLKAARADSLRLAKEERQNIRDSIIAETPRILETYAIPDSMQYKRIISWTVDQDFHKMDVGIPDTSFNYRFYDLPFQRNDVNASWLGVSGSAVQYYDYFNRKSNERVDFYDAYESWSFSPGTLPHYNTKTPYTELGYFGTLLAGDDKESDNLHIFTTQNITPEFNFSLLYDRYGGAGILENEETVNKTTVVQANYLGKKYTMHAGYIYNMVSRDENGGINDLTWIRDTTVDGRDIRVNLTNAHSRIKKNTVFLDQQLRIPFNFIMKMRAKKDSTLTFDSDSMRRDITTAYIGHSSEFSTYTRTYTDNISDDIGREFYNNVFNYNDVQSADSMRVMKLDNKFFIRLQPWSSEGVVSKLDVGVGDVLRTYFDSTSVRPQNHTENSFYIYAGAEGQLRNSFFWDAKAKYTLLGHDFGDFEISANGRYNFYPFRRERKSPVSVGVHFESTLLEPTWYQQHINANHFKWDNEFGKISNTSVLGTVDIPRWKLNARVGYALLANNIWYDNEGIIRQNQQAMSVLNASLRKEFVLGPLHLDNKLLFQLSSNQDVLPLPKLALNLKYYLQFVVQRDETKTNNIMVMQIGANAFYNTPWHSPAWNPNLGVFHNQTENLYTNGPYFDIFVNVQWKRATIFIKYQNAGGGWPMDKFDYFSANRYIVTKNGMEGLKLGIYWPFYAQPRGYASPPGSVR